MGRLDALTSVDSVALKRGREALRALDSLRRKFVDNGYVTMADLELLGGIQYNLEAMTALTEKSLQMIDEWDKNGCNGGGPLRLEEE